MHKNDVNYKFSCCFYKRPNWIYMTNQVILRRLENKEILTFFKKQHSDNSGNNQVENIFLESVTFQFHARMCSSEVAQSIKSYGHLSDHGVETALSHCHDAFFRYTKYINPRPRRGCHGNLSSDWLITGESGGVRNIFSARVRITVIKHSTNVVL